MLTKLESDGFFAEFLNLKPYDSTSSQTRQLVANAF
jgi:hypothetical protein